ncbi:hypothetical protein [Siminovitchia terrae]|uniref:hypothetical protein n=1 Tax=Siminovitchia terrae TaxID=1914933 RepID=UPI0028AA1C4C|nr:hypothetical protein [Siminovitchia terrae]
MEKKLLYSDSGLSTFTEKQEEAENIVWTGAKRESQLDLIEKKLDRVLDILENGDLSTSVSVDSKEISKIIWEAISKMEQRSKRL